MTSTIIDVNTYAFPVAVFDATGNEIKDVVRIDLHAMTIERIVRRDGDCVVTGDIGNQQLLTEQINAGDFVELRNAETGEFVFNCGRLTCS